MGAKENFENNLKELKSEINGLKSTKLTQRGLPDKFFEYYSSALKEFSDGFPEQFVELLDREELKNNNLNLEDAIIWWKDFKGNNIDKSILCKKIINQLSCLSDINNYGLISALRRLPPGAK